MFSQVFICPQGGRGQTPSRTRKAGGTHPTGMLSCCTLDTCNWMYNLLVFRRNSGSKFRKDKKQESIPVGCKVHTRQLYVLHNEWVGMLSLYNEILFPGWGWWDVGGFNFHKMLSVSGTRNFQDWTRFCQSDCGLLNVISTILAK